MAFEKYSEMAAPRGKDSRKTYYHGTPTRESAAGIMRDGIAPGSKTRGKGKLAPVAGKAYVTPVLRYAIVYALGGNMLGARAEPLIEKYGRNGYLFVVPGAEMKDIEPDEDSVGEILHDLLSRRPFHKYRYGKDFPPLELNWLVDMAHDELSGVRPSDIGYGSETYVDPDTGEEEYDPYEDYDMLERVREYVDYADFAAAGKHLVPMMSDDEKLQLIDFGAHIAHGGVVRPAECWEFDRARNEELAKDGSNFFEIARRVEKL